MDGFSLATSSTPEPPLVVPCPACRRKFSPLDLAPHIERDHKNELLQSSSSSSKVDEDAMLGLVVEEEGPLSLGLAYHTDKEEDGISLPEESQRVFNVERAQKKQSTVATKRRQRSEGGGRDDAFAQMVIDRKKKPIDVDDLDDDDVVEEEKEEQEEEPLKKAKTRGVVEAIVLDSSVISEVEKSKVVFEAESISEVEVRDESSFVVPQALGLTGSTRTTRRRRKELEEMIGEDVIGKRSENAVFKELERMAAKQKTSSPPKRTKVVATQTQPEEVEYNDGGDGSLYSVIPEEQVGNERIFDLSQRAASALMHMASEQSSSSYAQTPNPEDVLVKKLDVPFVAVTPGKDGRRRTGWIRGSVNGHEVLFAEPKNANKLFSGFYFLVTGCKVVNELDRAEDHIGYFVTVNQGRSQKKVLLADWIHDAVTHHGGKELFQSEDAWVGAGMGRLANLMESFPPFPSNIICISEKPHRTIKWLMSVAANVPCVKWKWLHECIRHGKLMDISPFLLKVGFSVLSDQMIKYKPRNEKKLIMDGKKVELIGDSHWKERWSSVLKEMGAECVSRLHVGNEASLDYIFMDEDLSTNTDSILAKAMSLKIPIVTPEFIIQCIIHNKVLRPSDHPSFTIRL